MVCECCTRKVEQSWQLAFRVNIASATNAWLVYLARTKELGTYSIEFINQWQAHSKHSMTTKIQNLNKPKGKHFFIANFLTFMCNGQF